MTDKRWIIALVVACILPVAALILATRSSGNRQQGFGSNEYQVAHVFDTCGNYADLNVDTWYTHEDGITIKLTDGTFIYCPNGTYILSQDRCPICSRSQ